MTNKNKNFLLIDDNPEMAQLFTAACEIVGVTPFVCHDAMEALNILSVQEFDAVILDLSMPVLDGLELSEQIRMNESMHRDKKPVCIVYYTAHNIDRAILSVAARTDVEKIFQKGSTTNIVEMLEEVKECCCAKDEHRAPEVIPATSTSREAGRSHTAQIVGFVAVFAMILTVSYFNYQMKAEKDRFDEVLHGEQEKWAKDWSLMKSERDRAISNCGDNLKGKDSLEIFIGQKGLQAPPDLLSEKSCTE